MACPHSNDDRSCPRCAATRDADAQAVTQENLDDTLLRARVESKAAPLPTGSRLGRYVILDVLGVGGMGMVYAAYDPVLDRRVAIKVLRSPKGSSAKSSTEGRSRLLREAQAMAQLSHPNVVPVYDVGTDERNVFVAMELIRGVTLNTWLKEKRPTWRAVLDVFLGAGRGLEAAHAAGLVHRDFKPANVLMGEDGRARITDFGLARSTRTASSDSQPSVRDESSDSVSLETPLTHVGAVMGSPGYMAPEQYDGADTSPATDQYGFCVSLYEALYGQRPFQGPDLVTLGKLAHEAQVPAPPRGSPVPAWLFPIVARGLSASPSQRHPSMTALLDALSRDPARARRRVALVAASVLALAGVVGGASWASQRSARACRASAEKLSAVWNDAARARAQAAFDATGKSFARVSWEHARDTMDRWSQDWSAAHLDACDATHVRREQTDAQLALRLQCLDRRLDELSTLSAELGNADAELVGHASDAVARLSPLSGCANLKALEARAKLAPEAQQTVARLEAQVAQGRLLVAMGRLQAARERIEPAVAAAEQLAVPTFRGEALHALGELEAESSRFVEARAAWERAAEQSLSAGDDALAARILTALVSLVGWRLERPAEGLVLASLASGVLARQGGDRTVEVALDEARGDAQWQGGDRAAALASYRRALAGAIALQGPTSNDVARLHSSVGWVLMEQGHLTEARREYEASRAIRERNQGSEHPSLGATWNELGSLASQEGDYARSVAAYERAREINELALGPRAFRVTRALLNTAEDLAASGKAAEAEAALTRAVDNLAHEASPPPSGHMQVARIRAQLAVLRKKPADAVAEARRAVQIAEQQYGAEHPDTAVCLLGLGRTLVAVGRPAEALAALQRFQAMAEKLELTGGRDAVESHRQLAAALVALGRPEEALPVLERALDRLQTVEANHTLRAEVRLALANALWATKGDQARARELAEEAAQGFTFSQHADGQKRALAWLEAHR
ncbi:MAG: tetratricopeptide repeat protein [Myxococcota bacterium]